VARTSSVPAGTSRSEGSSRQAAENPPAAPRASSGGGAPANPTDAPDATSASAPAAAAAADGSEETLPFTGARMLPLVLAAMLLVMAGAGLRQAARHRA
jgi:hypothetical protein